MSRDAARAARVWRQHRERRTPKTAKRGEEASQGRKERKERESGEEPPQPHVNPSVPTLFSSLFRRPFVHNNPVQRSAAPLPARRRRTGVDDETDLSRPLTGVEDRTAPSQRRRTWWFVRLRTGMSDNFPWSSLAGTNISTRSATNSRY